MIDSIKSPASKWSPYGYRDRRYIIACSCGPLVYIRTLKCGSTFFWKNLKERSNWYEINFEDIDWKRQHVFSHMLEPVSRRHKAITEFIEMTGTQDLLFQDQRFQKFIAHVPLLDQHSVSYHDYYGNLSWMMDWIPIQGDYNSVIEHTERLLLYYGIRMFKWDYDWEHRSTSEKKQVEEKVIELWNDVSHINDNRPEYSSLYLERDIELYNNVIKKFNPTGATWPETSWLRDRIQFQ